MKYAYLDASAGVSGDMLLGALLDLDYPHEKFNKAIKSLGLPVKITIRETKRGALRALKVEVAIEGKSSKARKWKDIETFIEGIPFSPEVKKNARAVFKNLLTAEAKVHGHTFEKAHLHEAGADDALVDIIGTCYLIEKLELNPLICSPLNVGTGWVKAAHGILPVPPPAVGELLKNVPVYSAWVNEELVTPTGAALVSTLAEKFIPFPEICYDRIGYGAGSRDFPHMANILRIFSGDASYFEPGKKIYVIEANIDDSNPQVLAHFFDRALELGALDVFLTPITMKKNRLGTKLTVLSEIDKIDTLIGLLFRETSSIGVRFHPVERRVLRREIKKVSVLGEKVSVKVSFFEGQEVSAQPEFDNCRQLAKKKDVPLKEIIRLAVNAYKGGKKAIDGESKPPAVRRKKSGYKED
ncbi:MAG: nickel pincer cofactor biosynthesis protein LarC [Candidatus Aminicenantes bacterium]|nr:nickel pincer cofactor biosynthesis protein LarC [Candidatus Aminicenantes bacterium]